MFKVPMQAGRILAVSMGGLGDTVLFGPVLRALRRKYPHSVIELLTANQLCREIYSGCPEVDSVVVNSKPLLSEMQGGAADHFWDSL